MKSTTFTRKSGTRLGRRIVLILASLLLAGVAALALIPRTPAAQVAAAALQRAPGQVTTLLHETSWRATHFAVQPGASVAWLPAIGSDGNNRLYRLDANSGTVTDFALPSDRGGGWFVGVRFASDGSLWLAWDQTLVRFDPNTAKSVRYVIPTASAFEVNSEKGKWVRDLAVASDGAIWLSRQHATSLLRFDPVTTKYTEVGLGGFGVPDKIRLDSTGKLWLTLARDPVTMQELTRAAVFDPSTGATRVINEWAGGITFDAQGRGLILGKAGLVRVDGLGTIIDRLPAPALVSAADLVTSANGKLVITSKATNSVAIYDETTRLWTIQKLPTHTGRIFSPPGYTGPTEVDMTEQITDAHTVGSNVFLLAPGSKSLFSVQL
jgi:streptogramin lyase